MKPGDEDEAWRQIVENYGDRPQFDDDTDDAVAHLEDRPPAEPTGWRAPEPDPIPEPEPIPDPEPTTGPAPFDPGRMWAEGDEFVPPPVAPLPLAEPRRMIAWIGLFAVPTIYLVAVILTYDFAAIIDAGLLAWLIGGFGYLVWTMPKRPHDPWDDGSRL